MRVLRLCVIATLLATLTPLDSLAAPRRPAHTSSPPGQVTVVTVNAKQNRVLGLSRFLALFELPKALRFRPRAFDGGFRGAVAAPDVIVVQEVRPSNLEILVRLLRQRFPYKYVLLEPAGAAAAFVVNTGTVSVQGEVTTWEDECTTEETPSDGRASRAYPIAHLTEIATGAPFVVAGVHIAKSYTNGQAGCVPRNVATLRAELADETAPVIIGGDFNRRATVDQYECDPDERSTPNHWWTLLTAPDESGRAYADAVRQWHRDNGVSMADEWTHEQRQARVVCDQTTRFKRSRIDYLFSNAVVAQAHADHPGWAGREPGTRHPVNDSYSDHRFVWGRFVVSGPPRPLRPVATAGARGRIDLAWQPVAGATAYVVLRGVRGHSYGVAGRVGADVLTFADVATVHGRSYRYAVAPVGADGGTGHESLPAFARADARGPRPRRLIPSRRAGSVDPRAAIAVRFDELVAAASVAPDTIRLWQGRRRIPGVTVVSGRRVLTLDPPGRLDKGKTYRVAVDPVEDTLGNPGPRLSWTFTTVAPPSRDGRGRRR